MKKSTTKLVLNHQTLRTLAHQELTRVVGGQANGPDITRLVSSCTDPLSQSPTQKK